MSTACRVDDCAQRHCCVCGRRHLADSEPQTCVHCVGQVRRDLAAIVELAALGAERIDGWPPKSPSAPGNSSRSAEQPPLIGDLGVMLAPGSQGAFWAAGDWRGKPPVNDNLPTDPVPVEWLLCSWEDDWRETLGVPSAQPDRQGPLAAARRFLDHHHGWAAQHHPAFDEYAADLAKARTMLEGQLAAGDRPEPTAVACFECGGQLTRAWTDDGLDDNRKCRKCRTTYEPEQYWFAVRAKMENGTEEDAS